MSCSTSSMMVSLTSVTFSFGSFLMCSSTGKILVIVPIDRTSVLVHVGTRELHVVGEQQSDSAELALERQRLTLELDLMIAQDVRPHVRLGRLLHVGMTELEHDLRVA